MGSYHVCLIVGQVKSRVCWANLRDVAIRWHARTLTQLTLSQKSQGVDVGFLPYTTLLYLRWHTFLSQDVSWQHWLGQASQQALDRGFPGWKACGSESLMTVDLSGCVQEARAGRPGAWILVSNPMMIVLMPWVTLDEHSGQKCPEPSDLWLCEWVIHPGKQVAWPQLVKTVKQTSVLETYFHQLSENLGRQRKCELHGLGVLPCEESCWAWKRKKRPARQMRQEFGVRC